MRACAIVCGGVAWVVGLYESVIQTEFHIERERERENEAKNEPNGTVILWRKRVKSSSRLALNHEIEGFYSKQEIGYQLTRHYKTCMCIIAM